MDLEALDRFPAHLTWKEKLALLCVDMMRAFPDPEEYPLEHTFGRGMYTRKIRIPAGTLFLGREHLEGHEVALMSGSAILITAAGRRRFDAVSHILTQPGFHTLAYCLTDIEAWTAHPNPLNLTDTRVLEDRIFGPVGDLAALGLQVEDRLRLTA